MTEPTGCPWPHKIQHPSKRAARRATRSLAGRTGQRYLAVYKCGAHWHLGHPVERPFRSRYSLRRRAS